MSGTMASGHDMHRNSRELSAAQLDEYTPSRTSALSNEFRLQVISIHIPKQSKTRCFQQKLILTLSQHVPSHCRFFQIRGASIKSPSKHCALPQAKAICRRSPAETTASQKTKSKLRQRRENDLENTKLHLTEYVSHMFHMCFTCVSHSYHSY